METKRNMVGRNQWALGLGIALAALLAAPSASAQLMETVVFELETEGFNGLGSGATRGPDRALFPANTEIMVDVVEVGADLYDLTFRDVEFPDLRIGPFNIQYRRFTVLPTDFTLRYDANTGGINDPIDSGDLVLMDIEKLDEMMNPLPESQQEDPMNIEFTTDPTVEVGDGCMGSSASTPLDGMPFDPNTDELVLVANFCFPVGGIDVPYGFKLGGIIPLPVPEPGAGLSAMAGLFTLAGLSRRRGESRT